MKDIGDIDKIVVESRKQEQTKHPKAKNGLLFGFIEDRYINALNDNN